MEHTLRLKNLYQTWKNEAPVDIIPLNTSSASPRLYFRLLTKNKSVIGVYNADIKENKAFFYFTRLFREDKVNLPELYIVSENESYYLVEDLGDINLLSELKRQGETEELKYYYKTAILQLLKMQIYGRDRVDFESYSYPRAEFDEQSVLWDLNYFKYYFLKLSGIAFDEQLLENDFQRLSSGIQNLPWTAFMFRDFQARNIQIFEKKPWLIDYQGGRKGPMLYDLVSLLFQASADLSPNFREEMKQFYKNELRKLEVVDDIVFEHEFNKILFIRILQTLGAYGFRGLIEKKPYFIQSIPLALKNLKKLIQNQQFKAETPYFIDLLNQLVELKSIFVIK
jgi:aminoglycoside/choline kinase family phosphotransferase